MDTQTLIASIDAEIARLEEAKSLLTGSSSGRASGRAGRAARATKTGGRTGKRTLSPEALERIREGQRKRWAKVRRAKKA